MAIDDAGPAPSPASRVDASAPSSDSAPPNGLSSAEAARRLRADGPNALPDERRASFLSLVAELAREPMLALLALCGLAYLALGDAAEAALLIGFTALVVAIALLQRRRAERALAALRDLSAPRALVIRDGERIRIPGRDLVRGDLVVLGEGDRVPADGVLLDARQLAVDESALTGESVAVDKPAAAGVSAGTLVVSGQGVMQVDATGPRTAMGRIGRTLADADAATSPLQRQTAALVRRIAIGVGVLCLASAAAWTVLRGDLVSGLLGGLALAMALLPEELPVVLTVFFALGAWRLSQRRVLVRRLTAVETLGAVGVLCVDKTGTLTENRMAVRTLWPANGPVVAVGADALPEAAHALVEFAVLATRVDPFDPMERAIRALGVERYVEREHLHDDWAMVRAYPLSPELLAMSQVWEDRADGSRVIAAKGAPEAVARLCHLDGDRLRGLAGEVDALAARGLRVLAVARARVTHAGTAFDAGAAMPPDVHDYAFEWLGLLGLADPMRERVPDAIAACRQAGIRVMMITGDHPATAAAIARQAGLPVSAPSDDEALLTGAAIDAMDDATLARRLAAACVIARATPDHKLRIVRALRAGGAVVGMTGDGVNDAPALRAADVGVAMGRRGTDVAREAADLVLADDDFDALVEAVGEGRRIFGNLRRAAGYLLAVHLPIAGLALAPLAWGGPLILLPAHIAFLELVIDPACALVFEAVPLHADAMRRAPRAVDASLFESGTVRRALLGGSAVLVAALAGWHGASMAGRPRPGRARSRSRCSCWATSR